MECKKSSRPQFPFSRRRWSEITFHCSLDFMGIQKRKSRGKWMSWEGKLVRHWIIMKIGLGMSTCSPFVLDLENTLRRSIFWSKIWIKCRAKKEIFWIRSFACSIYNWRDALAGFAKFILSSSAASAATGSFYFSGFDYYSVWFYFLKFYQQIWSEMTNCKMSGAKPGLSS